MSEKRVMFLAHDKARQNVAAFAMLAPDGWRVTFEPPKRNSES